MFFFFFYLSEGMENCKKSGKNQGKVGEFRGGLQVTTLVILMIEILGYLCLFYCINTGLSISEIWGRNSAPFPKPKSMFFFPILDEKFPI